VSGPQVYMLCGFVSPGKTSYARTLEAGGCVRLSIDEEAFERHGRHGVDYDEGEYPEHVAPMRRDIVLAGCMSPPPQGYWLGLQDVDLSGSLRPAIHVAKSQRTGDRVERSARPRVWPVRVEGRDGQAAAVYGPAADSPRSRIRSHRASHWNQRMPIPANTTM
jgi:hypothetical protein